MQKVKSVTHVTYYQEPTSAFPQLEKHQRQGLIRGSLQLASSKGEEKAFVRQLLQKGLHPLPHSLIPLVDKLLAEVAVNLLISNAFLRWWHGINKIGNLCQNKKIKLRAMEL